MQTSGSILDDEKPVKNGGFCKPSYNKNGGSSAAKDFQGLG